MQVLDTITAKTPDESNRIVAIASTPIFGIDGCPSYSTDREAPARVVKVAFVQEEMRERFGFMTLSAVLKLAGHTCDIFIDEAPGDVFSDVLAYEPDIIAFSTMTPGIGFALNYASRFKAAAPHIPVIMGGPHPTYYQEVIEEDCLDAICVGEGEDAMLEIADRLAEGKSFADIANCHVKENGEIFRNEMRRLKDPDLVPYPDRDLFFDKFKELREEKTRRIYLIRGCPFECTYCFNHALKKMTRGKGKFLRQGSVERAIDEIKWLRDTYGMTWLQISSDTLNVERKWFMKFLDLYEKEVKIPFLAAIRVDFIDEEMVAKMKSAGCDRVDYAIEHGNEEMRSKMLKRPMSNETVINSGNLFNKYKIRVHTANLFGVPHETVDTVLETVHINQAVRPERAHVSILNPFERTEIRDYTIEQGFLDKDADTREANFGYRVVESKHELAMVLDLENPKRLLNLFYFFSLMVSFPILEKPLLMLSHLPTNRLFLFIYAVSLSWVDIKYASTFSLKMVYVKRLLMVLVRGHL